MTSLPAARSVRWPEWTGLVLVSVVSLLLIHGARGELSVQSQRNLNFAHRPSLARSLERYGMLRPPLYPSLLWAAERVRIHPFAVVALLHVAALAGVAALARRASPAVSPLLPTAAYALGHYCAVNLHQFTAEAVVAAGLPAMALLLWRHRTTGGAGPLLAAAAIGAAMGLSRLFAAVLAPAALVLAALLPGRLPWRRRAAHAAAALLVASLPVALWAVAAHSRTGFLTGTDRTAVRTLPAEVSHWKELTGVGDHVVLTGRTLLVDFFSPDRYAAHVVVTHPLALRPLEALSLALLAWALIAALWQLLRWRRDRAGEDSGWDAAAACAVSPAGGAAGLIVLYLGLTAGIWSLSNNDPIYTRFLFPAYGLLCVAAFGADAALARLGGSSWARLPRLALLGACLAAQAWRHLYALPLPPRFEG